jgi:hypothetical protein
MPTSPDVESLKCETTLIETSIYATQKRDQFFEMYCPAFCLSDEVMVIGTTFYFESSSICRAAIHAGVIDNEKGGQFTLVLQDRMPKHFLGSMANQVLSISLAPDTSMEYKSFTL